MFNIFLKILIICLFQVHLQETFRTRRDIIDDIWGDLDETTSSTTSTVTSAVSEGDSSTASSSCTCVPYYLCQNGTINKDGEGIIDIRVQTCNSYLEKCCGEQDITQAPSPTPPTKSKGCGFRNINGVGFKIKESLNREAEFGEFPWMTAIFVRKDKIPVYQCGGALIHPEVVITAAHCVKDKTNLKIRVGEWDTQTTKEQYPFQDIDVASVVIHPLYKAGVLFNDIALLFLKNSVQRAPHIDTICLPPPEAVIDNSRCFSSGWGKTEFGKQGAYQVILKKVDLPMVPRSQCQSYLRKTRLGQYFELHESFVCAGGEAGKDTCTGDGGSPLVCPIEGHKNRYFQVGIVAWGIGCGNAMVPGVYVNVALFRKWIDEQMVLKQLQKSEYEY